MSDYIVIFLLFVVIIISLIKKVNAFELFIEGAKTGLNTSVNMFSNLLVFMIAVSLLLSSGILEFIKEKLNFEYSVIIIQSLVRPFSSSSSLSMMIENYQLYGVDSLLSLYSTMIHYVSDATFYLVPFYFGLYNIKINNKLLVFGFICNIFSYVISFLLISLFF